MKGLKVVLILVCIGLCLGSGNVSPKLIKAGRDLAEYVINS